MLPVGTGVCPTALTEPAFIRAYTYRPSNAVHLQRHASKQRRAHRLSAKSSTDDELSERLKRAEAEAKDLRERLAAAGSGEAQVGSACNSLLTILPGALLKSWVLAEK